MTPEHAEKLAQLDRIGGGERENVVVTFHPDGKTYSTNIKAHVPQDILRYLIDPCAAATWDTLRQISNGNLTDAEKSERWKAKQDRKAIRRSVAADFNAMR